MAISFVSYLTGVQLLISLLVDMDHSQIVVKKSWICISNKYFSTYFHQTALFSLSVLRKDVCGCISKQRNNEAAERKVLRPWDQYANVLQQ